jgi:hypothetical protein
MSSRTKRRLYKSQNITRTTNLFSKLKRCFSGGIKSKNKINPVAIIYLIESTSILKNKNSVDNIISINKNKDIICKHIAPNINNKSISLYNKLNNCYSIDNIEDIKSSNDINKIQNIALDISLKVVNTLFESNPTVDDIAKLSHALMHRINTQSDKININDDTEYKKEIINNINDIKRIIETVDDKYDMTGGNNITSSINNSSYPDDYIDNRINVKKLELYNTIKNVKDTNEYLSNIRNKANNGYADIINISNISVSNNNYFTPTRIKIIKSILVGSIVSIAVLAISTTTHSLLHKVALIIHQSNTIDTSTINDEQNRRAYDATFNHWLNSIIQYWTPHRLGDPATVDALEDEKHRNDIDEKHRNDIDTQTQNALDDEKHRNGIDTQRQNALNDEEKRRAYDATWYHWLDFSNTKLY